MTARTFIGKQIHLCKGHRLFRGVLAPSLAVSLFLFISGLSLTVLLLSVYSSGLRSSCCWSTPALQRKPTDCTISAFIVTSLMAGPLVATFQLSLECCDGSRMGAHFSNWLSSALCLHVTHLQTHTRHYTSQHSSSMSALPPMQERKVSHCLH